MKFKVGDRVKLIDDKFGDRPDNPVWGGSQGYVEGTVYEVEKNTKTGIFVRWDNGSINCYHTEVLEYMYPPVFDMDIKKILLDILE